MLFLIMRINKIPRAQARLNHVFLARKLSCAEEIVDPVPSNQWSRSGWPWGALSNEQHKMGGMEALFARRFLFWAGSGLVCGARLTCTLQKFICALDIDKEALAALSWCNSSFDLTCHFRCIREPSEFYRPIWFHCGKPAVSEERVVKWQRVWKWLKTAKILSKYLQVIDNKHRALSTEMLNQGIKMKWNRQDPWKSDTCAWRATIWSTKA